MYIYIYNNKNAQDAISFTSSKCILIWCGIIINMCGRTQPCDVSTGHILLLYFPSVYHNSKPSTDNDPIAAIII